MMALKAWLRKRLRSWLEVEPIVQEKLLATVTPRMLTLDKPLDLSDWAAIREMSTRCWPFFEYVALKVKRLDETASRLPVDAEADRHRVEYLARRSELMSILNVPEEAGEQITKILERDKRIRTADNQVTGFGRN